MRLVIILLLFSPLGATMSLKGVISMQSTIDQISQNSFDIWQSVAGIIGILAFVISVINTIYFFRIRKVSYSVKLIDYSSIEIDTSEGYFQRLRVNLEIVNNSQLPISITDLKLLANNTEYSESKLPFKIFHAVSKINHKEYPQFFYNEHLPLQLDPLGSLNCNIVYLLPVGTVENSETPLSFRIRTNRNTEQKFELTKGKQFDHRHITLQSKN